MYTTDKERQLFRSLSSQAVIRVPIIEKGFVDFLFGKASYEYMKEKNWEAIDTSDYLGNAPEAEDKLIDLLQSSAKEVAVDDVVLHQAIDIDYSAATEGGGCDVKL